MAHMSTPVGERLAAALTEFVNLGRWSDRRRFLRRHRKLMSQEAIDALAGQLAIRYADDDLNGVVLVEVAVTTLANAMSRGVRVATSPPGLGDDELIPALLMTRLRNLDEALGGARKSANPRFLYEFVKLCRSVAELVSEQIPYLRARTFNQCGEILYRLYQATGGVGALAEAETYFQRAWVASHPSSAELPLVMNSLGIVLRVRARLNGDQEDLQAALDLFLGAVSRARSRGDTRNHRAFLSNVGNAELDHYAFTGDIAGINDAIEHYNEALSLYEDTEQDRSEQRAVQTALGNALLLRLHFQPADASKDLYDALSALRAAAKNAVGFPDEPAFWANLARGLDDAHYLTGDPKFMDEAAEIATRALQGSRDLAVLGATVRVALADALISRYKVRHDTADLAVVVDQLRHVLPSVPETSTERPSVLESLAQALALRSSSAAAQGTDGQDATSTYRICCDLASQLNPAVTLIAGRSWGDWALGRQGFDEAVEAYRWASAAGHDLFKAQQLRRHREDWLSRLQGMPEDHAYACTRAGHPGEGLLAMERDRAILLSAALQLHVQLDELRTAGFGEICDRYESSARRLDILQRQRDNVPADTPDLTVSASPVKLETAAPVTRPQKNT